MELLLLREPSTRNATEGALYVRECFTLEDPVRAEKIAGKTAIPAGRYRVIINRSQRFGKDLPLLLDVPGFTGVRIHAGNTSADTEGCVLIGQTQTSPDDNYIGASRAAMNALMPKLRAALARGEEVWLEIQ